MSVASLTRRCFCRAGLLPMSANLLSGRAATATPPVQACRFSLEEGWGTISTKQYVARHASANDSSGVPQVVQRIREVLSISTSFEVLIAEDENNAMAMVRDGRRFLIVDVGFLRRLNGIAHTRWAAIQVIAHEVGHHIAGFSADSYRNEFSADYWSGQALQRLGSARDAATAAILTIGSQTNTSSHPNKYARATVITRGWDDAARGIVDERYKS